MAPAKPQSPVQINTFQKFGFFFLLIYLFILYSRIFDIKLYQLRIPAIATTFTLLFTIVSGGVIAALSSKPGKLLGAFTVWMCICIPFSIWPRVSFNFWTDAWPRTLIVFLALAGLVFTFDEFRRVVYALAWGLSGLALVALKFGEMTEGRLFLPQGKFSNPNDLAQVLLMGLPFLLYVIMTANFLTRLVAASCMIPIFYCLIRTGSRGGLLGFLVIAGFIFFRAPASGKFLVVFGSMAVLMAGAVLLPYNLKHRYVTLFSAKEAATSSDDDDLSDDGHLEAVAASSAESRQQLLKDSIRLTFMHPIFGVGPNMFPTAEEQMMADRGIHVPSLGTHNSYTQISSETGLIGFFIYYAAFAFCVKRTNTISRFANAKVHPNWQQISRMAFCLKISLLSYAVTSFFSHVAYQSFFTTLAGLVIAMERAIQPQFQEWLAGGQRNEIPGPGLAPAAAALPEPQTVYTRRALRV